MDRFVKLMELGVKGYCQTYGLQCCHMCEDIKCGDNTNPLVKYIKKLEDSASEDSGSRGSTSAVVSAGDSLHSNGLAQTAALDNTLPAQAQPASNTSQAKIAAAEKLCKLYFEIAAEVIGEGEVRKRVQRLLQP